MDRVVILGSAGAGKTDLAVKISGLTGLRVVHLDVLFWTRGWKPAPHDRALRDLAAEIAADRWILDGNFLSPGDEDARFDRADTVIFLDVGRTTCVWRVLKRR